MYYECTVHTVYILFITKTTIFFPHSLHHYNSQISLPLNKRIFKTHSAVKHTEVQCVWFSVLFSEQIFYFDNIRCQDCTVCNKSANYLIHQSESRSASEKVKLFSFKIKKILIQASMEDSGNKTITTR